MRYGTHRRAKKRRIVPLAGTGLLVLCLIGVFSFSVYEFRKPDAVSAAPSATPTAPVTSTSLAMASVSGSMQTEASLHDVSGGSAGGTATRGKDKDAYTLKIKTSLPGIDRDSQYYEGWLLRPIPFAFFSVGEMDTNTDGAFVLEWSGESGKNFDDYTQVIVTLEAKDGNPDPSGHILEGEFK